MPETAAELMVRAAVPVEESVTDWVVAELSATLPKLRLDVLRLRVGTEALSCRAKVFETLPAEAVSVAVCAVETAEAVAEKLALVAPEATVIEAGTATAVELLVSVTACPLVPAAELSVTVQASVAAPVTDALEQEIALSAGAGEPVEPEAFAAVKV